MKTNIAPHRNVNITHRNSCDRRTRKETDQGKGVHQPQSVAAVVVVVATTAKTDAELGWSLDY